MKELRTSEPNHVPPLSVLRAWAKDPDNEQCWGLDAVADELERLRAQVVKTQCDHWVHCPKCDAPLRISTKPTSHGRTTVKNHKLAQALESAQRYRAIPDSERPVYKMEAVALLDEIERLRTGLESILAYNGAAPDAVQKMKAQAAASLEPAVRLL